MHESSAPQDAHNEAFKDLEEHSSKPRDSTSLAILSSLRLRYPDYTVTTTRLTADLLAFAKAGNAKVLLDMTGESSFTHRVHLPPSERTSNKPGTMKDKVLFGKYDYEWSGHCFLMYHAEYSEYFRTTTTNYLLYKRDEADIVEGRSKVVDQLIATVTKWNLDLHDEVYMFDQEQWIKNKGLWASVQESTWDDVILDAEMKDSLRNDVQGFFDCKDDYKSFAVPWKRGIIFHGLPGNGKTISIKALMNSLNRRQDPIPTLYVKSLAGCHGPHYAIREIFEKAREMTPCLLVFEDLDSLITDEVRSFFLNEVDGLESNDGIMMIGSTNYLERLDAGIANRPSRFDRKYHFTLPAAAERAKYCEYWRSKLSSNHAITFPPALCEAIAGITDGFSFAYLKEAFVTSLLLLAAIQRGHTKKPSGPETAKGEAHGLDSIPLWRIMSEQVQGLRDEMEASRKSAEEAGKSNTNENCRPFNARQFQSILDGEAGKILS